MELKKFEAPTLAEALKVIKRELGPEAVILTTKNKKSTLGLMGKNSVEVTAVVSPDALRKKIDSEARMTAQLKSKLEGRPAAKVIEAYDILSGRRIRDELTQSVRPKVSSSSNSNTLAPPPAYASQGLTQRRYIDIQDDESPAEVATSRTMERTKIQQSSTRESQAQTNQATVPGLLQKQLVRLLNMGIDADLVRELGDELKVVMLREHLTREDLVHMRFARIIMSRIRVARPLSERLLTPTAPRTIAFLGPTGVGKTTTVAKIAAELVLNHRLPVCLVTTDTYKIAAIEQLQTYANILKIPLEVCPTAESLEELTQSSKGDEIFLVDTAGYGPRDERKLHELSEILNGVRCEKHLCVSATTRDTDLKDSVRRFQMFNPDYLVVTKMDETQIFGNIYNLGARAALPLSFFTMGQRVPEDIEAATRERIADLILNIAGSGEQWIRQIG
jgi:flagellar biosynthesis protein FlhF